MKRIAYLLVVSLLIGCGGGGGGGGGGDATNGSTPVTNVTSATSTSVNDAMLNGTVIPNGLSTQAWFEYSTDSSLTNYSSTTQQSIGSGLSIVPVSHQITGLAGNTTYYFRVCASNEKGGTESSITSFITSSPGATPAVTTLAATSVGANTETLNGNVTANGLATTAWFEWGTNPALSTFTSTSSQAVGSGTTSQSVTAALTGLNTGTTYYFRVVASNSWGTTKGSILSFIPGASPAVTTLATTSVGATTATLNGTVIANGLATTAWFEWGTDSTLLTSTSTSSQSVGSGTTSVSVNAAIPGLNTGTTYYYRVTAINGTGTTKGSILSFTPGVPAVTTRAATFYELTATMNGNVNPNGLATTAWFEWGTYSALNSATSTQSVGSGTTSQSVNAVVTGVPAGVWIYCRLVASNSAGITKGSIVAFFSYPPPTVTTYPIMVGPGIILVGRVVSYQVNGYGWFEWGTDSSLSTFISTPHQMLYLNNSGQYVNATLWGLSFGTTYYYRVAVSNDFGTSRGSILNFILGVAPAVTTLAATSVGTTMATLVSSVTDFDNNQAWFEWGTDPTLTTSTSTPHQYPNGTSGHGVTGTKSVVQNLTGLSPGTTYYYRIVGENTFGTAKGSILNFTTSP